MYDAEHSSTVAIAAKMKTVRVWANTRKAEHARLGGREGERKTNADTYQGLREDPPALDSYAICNAPARQPPRSASPADPPGRSQRPV